MGHFLNVAYKVLMEEGKPLSYKEIINIGKEKGWLITEGKTPAESMRARLSENILHKKEKSLFMRTASGMFGLRIWLNSSEEYIAPRFKKSLLDEVIVVFPVNLLEKYVHGPGLYVLPTKDRKEMITELKPMPRFLAEENINVIQLISVFIVRFENKYLTYRRTRKLPEKRLHGYYSMFFGGHLNPDDVDLPLLSDFTDSINAKLMFKREFKEELRLPSEELPELNYKGLLYDNNRLVSRQHLGIVYDVYLNSSKYSIGERGFLMDSKFETLEEIENRKQDFENWSWIIIEFERNVIRGR
jgi:predicted NUDIX family phosphoesterase